MVMNGLVASKFDTPISMEAISLNEDLYIYYNGSVKGYILCLRQTLVCFSYLKKYP